MDDATANDYANLILRELRDSEDGEWRTLADELTEDIAQGRPVAIQRGKRGTSEVDLRRASEKAFAGARPLEGRERLELLVEGLRATLVDVPFMIAEVVGVTVDPVDAGDTGSVPRVETADDGVRSQVSNQLDDGPFWGARFRFEVPEEVAAEGERIGPITAEPQEPVLISPPDDDDLTPIRRLADVLADLVADVDRSGDR